MVYKILVRSYSRRPSFMRVGVERVFLSSTEFMDVSEYVGRVAKLSPERFVVTEEKDEPRAETVRRSSKKDKAEKEDE